MSDDRSTRADRVEFGIVRDPARSIWADWMRRHGADPNSVAMPGWIERREVDHQLAYEGYARDEKGAIRINDERTEVLRETQVVQLEGPPLPFPAADLDAA